jgi:hypothetical protein
MASQYWVYATTETTKVATRKAWRTLGALRKAGYLSATKSLVAKLWVLMRSA